KFLYRPLLKGRISKKRVIKINLDGAIGVQNLFCLSVIGVQNLFCFGAIGVQNLFCDKQD
ncbi:MAG: hypothetical protein VSS75_011770, partial [Candidatus Parabeggiatoa sp.]|nr:hypothetical protein [Candidatus Parabeggiatoa sp.]